jgi:hypothetical protein
VPNEDISGEPPQVLNIKWTIIDIKSFRDPPLNDRRVHAVLKVLLLFHVLKKGIKQILQKVSVTPANPFKSETLFKVLLLFTNGAYSGQTMLGSKCWIPLIDFCLSKGVDMTILLSPEVANVAREPQPTLVPHVRGGHEGHNAAFGCSGPSRNEAFTQ